MHKTAHKQNILLALWTVVSVPVTSWGFSCAQTPFDQTCLEVDTQLPKSLGFISGGFITLNTALQQVIALDVEEQDAQAFEQTLSSVTLGTDNINALTAPLRLNPRHSAIYYALRPELASEPATLANTPGLYLLPYLTQQMANLNAVYFIYKDAAGQLKQRAVPPLPADWDSLNKALKALNFSNISLQSTGIVSATAPNGQALNAIMDYQVLKGERDTGQLTFNTSVGDLNNDGFDDVGVVYSNGDQQALILQPNYAPAFVLTSVADLAKADAYLLATAQPAVIEIDLSANEYKGADISLNNFSAGDKIRFNLADGIVSPGAATQHSATANQYFSNLNTANVQRSDVIIHESSQSMITLMSSAIDIQNGTSQSNSLQINLTGGIKNKNLLFEFF